MRPVLGPAIFEIIRIRFRLVHPHRRQLHIVGQALTAGAKPQAWISGAPLVNPVGLAWHDGGLIIADPNPKAKTGQVYKADAAGKLSPLAGK